MPNSKLPSETEDFAQALDRVERSLQELKIRYIQVDQDQQQQATLQERQQQLKHQPTLAARSELQQLEAQLEELEFKLESRLFTWHSVKEPFWQIVRFGGLGVLIGWFLAIGVINHPRPVSTPSTATPTAQP